MKRIRILEVHRLAGAVLLLGLAAVPALAQDGDRPCSVQSIAGEWMFATEVGQQAFIPDQEGDITAIGTMNIDSEGNVNGEFDNTIAEFMSFPDNTYAGSITVDADCRGTLTFITSSGAMRTDSIAVVSQSEFWGMSRDPNSLWTYRVQRISRGAGPDALAAKIDAILQRLGLVPSAFESQ